MNELIVLALEKMRAEQFDAAIDLFEKASKSNRKDCAVFWGLIDCYLHDNRQEIFPVYRAIYKEHLEAFIIEGGSEEFIPHLTTLLEMHTVMYNYPQSSGKLAETLKWIDFLKLDKTLPEDRLMVNLALNRALMLLSSFTKRVEASIVIFERITAFHEQLGWQELASLSQDYLINFIIDQENGCPKNEHLTQALALCKKVFAQNQSQKAFYYTQCIDVYLQLKNWDKSFEFLLTYAKQGAYSYSEVESRFLNMVRVPALLEKFLHCLEADLQSLENPKPHFALFWHQCLKLKLGFLLQRNDMSAAINEAHQLVDKVLSAYPNVYYLYEHKITLFTTEGKRQEAMQAASQGFILANHTLANEVYSDLIRSQLSFYCIYISTVYEYARVATISNSDVFNLAYAIHFITENPQHFVCLKIANKSIGKRTDVLVTVIQEEELRAKIQAMLPVTGEVYDLRQERAAAWRKQRDSGGAVKIQNDFAAKINAKLSNLKDCCEKQIVPSLFALTAGHLKLEDLAMSSLPVEVQECARYSFFHPFAGEKLFENTSLSKTV